MKRLARGFTLIELVIALMLLALMTSVLFGSLQLAGRSWDSGEAKVARVTEMRQSQQFLREQITAAYPQRMPKVAEIPLLFSGERDELRYAAALPARVVEGGVLYFRLALAKDDAHSRLVLDRVLTDLSATEPPSFDGADRTVLAEGVREIKVGYFGRDPGAADSTAPTWRDRWDDRQQLPLLIRVEVALLQGQAWPALVVEPRRSSEAGCRAWDAIRRRCTGVA
jgi:general secretion pathway protein J